jgi:hypothetical protein
VFRTAVERGWVLLELARERGATLEDVFVRLTTHDAVERPAAEPEPPEPEPATNEQEPEREVAS